MIATGLGILEVLYQIMAFKKSGVFSGEHGESFAYDLVKFAGSFFENHHSASFIIIPFIIIIIFLEILFPPFAKAASIQLIARIYNGQKILLRDGVKYGVDSFFRMLGYAAAIKFCSFILIFSIFAFVVRSTNVNVLKILIIPFLIVLFITWIIGILLTYTQYFIVIDNLKVAKSMWSSVKMVLYYWEHTLLLIVLMIFIGARIILNAIFVLAIPAIIIVSTTYLAAITAERIGLIIGCILGGISFIFASYINAVADVWAMGVWVITFLKLSNEKEKGARDVDMENLPTEEEILKANFDPNLIELTGEEK
ncbi:hypothetical protein A2335_01225 [Candidatus Peregrinibacteria bacterium RIFOXYB2_FULL_32_7]|nr:MAG: hypothetical protein A2335_01225 [Candidatus Peregrinibacteria bacterium RIFOXYB2_FULL_32_7]